jgi:autotransporter-associated beta strand protein
MKKIIPFLAATIFFAAVQVQAAVHKVTDNTTSWKSVIDAAGFANGDTIEIARGVVYTGGNTINGAGAAKGFVLRAESGDGARHVWRHTNDVISFTTGIVAGGSVVVEGIDFENTDGSVGKYFLQAITVSATFTNIIIRDCNISSYGRGMIRMDKDGIATVENMVVENCIVQKMGYNSATYPVFGLKTAKISNITIRNSTFYSNKDNFYLSQETGVPINFLMENCTILDCNGGDNALMSHSNPANGSVITLRNSIISGTWRGDGSPFSVTKDIDFKSSGSVTRSNVKNIWTAYVSSRTYSAWTVSDEIVDDGQWDFADPANGDFTITGASANTLRTGGFGGACVGDPRSYPGYTPPEPGKLTWSGADNTLWNEASNWAPNELPSEAGTATINSGIAQSSGGKMSTTVILETGGTLKLASVPDTITKLELDGGTLQGANTLQAEITLVSKSVVSVPNAGDELAIPVSIAGSDTLVKIGAGTLYLTAASNAFAGTWRVEAGALKVDGAGSALGTEVKVDLRGGTLELSGEVVSLPGLFFENGAPLPVGIYTATSHASLVSGAGSLKITDSRVFTYVSKSRVSWESKFNWSPVRALVGGDTAVVEGSYDVGDGTVKAYDVELSPATFPTGAKLFLRDAARARLSLSAAASAARSAFTADIEVAKGVFYTSTTSKNLFGLDGTLTILDTAYFQPDARVETDTVTSGLLENKISPISIGATLYGDKPIVLSVSQNLDNHGGTYGLQLVKANNLAFTGDWLVQKTSLVGLAAACFGRSNTIYLSSGASLYLDVADATDKTQTINAALGAKIYLNDVTRLTSLVLGGTTYTEGELTASSHPEYISGTGSIKLGVVPVTSVAIATPDSVQAAVADSALQLSAVAYPPNADDQEITWSVTSGDATIDPSTGLLTLGANPGSVIVRAQTINGTAATKAIEVLSAPQLITAISISGPANMEMGESVVYTATYQPANATDVKLVWEITAGEADTVHLSNRHLQVISKATAPLTVKVSAQAAPDVSETKQTTILRATSYTWVANDAQTAGSDGAWEDASYWTPRILPQAGDTAYVDENATENKFALGTGGENQEHAKFPAKLFLRSNAKLRVAITNDNTAGLDPFTSAWDVVTPEYRADADFYLQGGTIGVYSSSAKTWGVDGTINVLAPSYLRIEGPSSQAALYVFAEVKGSSTLTLTGRESTMSNDPNETGAGLTYSESTIILRRSNPDFTGTWNLDLLNLYTKEPQGFGRGNIVVGTGRKLIVDHEKAVDSTATITIASGGKISTRQSSNITILVNSLIVGGQTLDPGYYSKNTPVAAGYFDNDRIIIKVGSVEQAPVESISISGPGQMAVGSEAQLTPLVLPSNAVQIVEWSVEPAELASVSSSGVLTSGTTAGCVTVTATATDGSGVFGKKTVAIGTASCATAVAAEDYGTLTLSPNPVQSELRIADEKVISEVRIYTLSATLLKTLLVNGREVTLDLSSYPSGAYIVVASYANSGKTAVKIVVKQ